MRHGNVFLNNVLHLGGAAPAQRDASATMAVVMDDELTARRLGVEPIGAGAIRPDSRDTCAWRIWVESEVWCREIGNCRHAGLPPSIAERTPRRTNTTLRAGRESSLIDRCHAAFWAAMCRSIRRSWPTWFL